MYTAGVKEIRQELEAQSAKELINIIQRLARFRKENKELLTFLLFEAHDIDTHLAAVREELLTSMLDIHPDRIYLAKKTIRKTLRIANKHVKLIGSKSAEADIRLHVCRLLQQSSLPIDRNPVLLRIFQNQLRSARKAIASLHEDLQWELLREADRLESDIASN
jgi:Zn-dependent oligopeptidase